MLLAAGGVWVGGWCDPADNALELNLTAVFKSEYRQEALVFGERQAQAAVYDLDLAAAGDPEPTTEVSDGGESEWRPRSERTRRRLFAVRR